MARNTLAFLSLSILIASIFTPPITEAPSQPPVITDTLYVGQPSWGPRKADPVRAYDTYSGELIFNVYDRLICMGTPVTDPITQVMWQVYEQYWEFSPSLATNVPAREDVTKMILMLYVPPDPTGFTFEDGSICIEWIDNNKSGRFDYGDTIYTLETDGSYRTWFVSPEFQVLEYFVFWRGQYTFHMRAVPVINFTDETGQTVDTFYVNDAEYSFKRGLVQDQYGSPMWMYYKPLFDQMNSDFFDSNETEPTAMTLAHLIDDAIEVSGNDLIINVGIPFPDTAFKQTLSLTWGSIVSKEFSLSIGCWNGDLYTDSDGDGYPDWWTTVRHVLRSPYDATGNLRWVGTGPYYVSLYDSTNYVVRLSRNANYWRGWPAPDIKAFLSTVEIRYISNWTQRRDDFIACNLDVCAVPNLYMGELLDSYREPLYPQIKTIKYISPVLSADAAFFQLTINPQSWYIGSAQFPDGIPPTFFNNTHVRRAFAYGFNRTRYIREAWNGEATCRETPLIHGLVPDYYTKAPDPPWTYDVSLDAAESELKQAMFGGASVWDSGFTVSLPYPTGNIRTKIAFEVLRDFFAELSTYDGRTGPPFTINVVEEYPWLYDQIWTEFYQPMFVIGWLADFADADNFMRPYMHSSGDFAWYQNFSELNGWGAGKDELLDRALKTPDGTERAAMYAELEQIYIDDCPSFPIAQVLGRRWCKYWVKGWYYNPLYPSSYYYHLYKEDACWGSVTGPTIGVPDGHCGMRDVGYVANHFRARAPDVTKVPPYDPRWATGAYGRTGCDVYGDRKVDMRDIGFMCAHFLDHSEP